MSANPVLQFLLTPGATAPSKAHDDDSCFDLFANEFATLQPGQTKIIDLGCRLILPEGFDLVLREKSGFASQGLIVGGGEVDNGYRGPLKAIVRFLAPDPAQEYGGREFQIAKGCKLCQGRLVRKINTTLHEITQDQFSVETDRGEGGFGSSGT